MVYVNFFKVKATRIFHFVVFSHETDHNLVITMYCAGRGCETTIIYKITLGLKTVPSARNITRSCSWPMKSLWAASGQQHSTSQGRLGLSLPPSVCWQAVAAGQMLRLCSQPVLCRCPSVWVSSGCAGCCPSMPKVILLCLEMGVVLYLCVTGSQQELYCPGDLKTLPLPQVKVVNPVQSNLDFSWLPEMVLPLSCCVTPSGRAQRAVSSGPSPRAQTPKWKQGKKLPANPNQASDPPFGAISGSHPVSVHWGGTQAMLQAEVGHRMYGQTRTSVLSGKAEPSSATR